MTMLRVSCMCNAPQTDVLISNTYCGKYPDPALAWYQHKAVDVHTLNKGLYTVGSAYNTLLALQYSVTEAAGLPGYYK